ncbi:hypothetical protein BDF20DRAFT_833385 [Mycotypha africana]|uniref:uncharacterized protein n=1 Tax=Mycotypha africana TaxID=64632 RepID=UPI002301D9FD|nr:uncharacterized protein BDF20DRAFT_833385 [Mycotypha africana]KAI8988541.1 hypothetical protein BDF20DRAFT_833385 [Mycotypha africana]
MTGFRLFLTIISILILFLTLVFSTNVQPMLEPCSCNGTITTRFDDMCICNGCQSIKVAYIGYLRQCPPEKTTKLNSIFAQKCQGIENTEDCEYFKRLPGKIRDDYKRCKDDLDSVHDDCENCAGCSFPNTD